MKPETRNFVRYWLAAILWTAVVLVASTDPFSAEHTGKILGFVLSSVFGSIDPARFAFIHFLVRKSAHVTEYAILALLFFRAWRGDHLHHWRFAWARQAWAICIAVAATDEFHQSFVPSRGSSLWDVALDAAGAAAVLAIVWLHWKWIGAPASDAAPAKQTALG